MININLEEILNKVIGIETKSDSFKLAVLEAMKEACNQAIDLCTWNAKTTFDCDQFDELDEGTTVIDRDSILNTKKQIV